MNIVAKFNATQAKTEAQMQCKVSPLGKGIEWKYCSQFAKHTALEKDVRGMSKFHYKLQGLLQNINII